MKKVTVLGSTGSIGRQALDVVLSHPEEFSVYALSAGRNTELLIKQARAVRPAYVSVSGDIDESLLPEGTRVLRGERAAEEISSLEEADVVVNGISGIAALVPLLAALRAGKRVALANKESIVCGSSLVDRALADGAGELLPVDSEQSAIFQCLRAGESRDVRQIFLTASGGPFWKRPLHELSSVTLMQALQHPTWNMGRKITIDSATLFNKGLEIIEACYLFHLKPEQITVVIHPQSIVHSAVEFADGTVIVNASNPDMRLPIQYALTYPKRMQSQCRALSFSDVATLEFYPADLGRFGALRLAYEALQSGGTLPIVYNGANEKAVALFLAGRIRFTDIEPAVEYAMQTHSFARPTTVEEIFEADAAARALVGRYFKSYAAGKKAEA